MSTKYLRRSRHHALVAAITGLTAVLCLTAIFVNTLGENVAMAIFATCAFILFFFITLLETRESLRCLRIAARWDRWDRRDLPPTT